MSNQYTIVMVGKIDLDANGLPTLVIRVGIQTGSRGCQNGMHENISISHTAQ